MGTDTSIYGLPSESHRNIGISWTALINQHYGIVLPHPLPDWLVELMLVIFKAHRAARVYSADTFYDMLKYAEFANRHQSDDSNAKENPATPVAHYPSNA
jgi:hypothetical protein